MPVSRCVNHAVKQLQTVHLWRIFSVFLCCLVKKYQFNSAVNCEFRHSKTSYQFEFLTRASSFVPVYWLNENICHDQYCAAELHGKFIYRDSGHLSREGSFLLGKLNNWYDEFKNLALSKISQNH